MTTTKSNSTGTITLVIRDGATIGRITRLGTTFRAARKNGTERDMRRVSQGFRTVESAQAWIEQA